MNPDVSIVICTYKRLDQAVTLALRDELNLPNTEVIIVDQGPAVTLPKARYTYINTSQVSLPAARNIGMLAAKGRVVIFLDDDTDPDVSLISAHLKAYDDPGIVGVAGRVIDDGQSLPANTNLSTGKMNALGTQFIQRFYSTKKQYVDFPYGCNMSFRRATLIDAGGFDEKFLPPLSAFEEIDAALKVKKFGKILFEPAALAYHRKARQGGTRAIKKNGMNMYYRCYGYFLARHSKAPHLSLLIAMKRSTFESPKSLGALIIGFYGHYKETLKGILSLKPSFAYRTS